MSYIYKYTYWGQQTSVWSIGNMIPTDIAVSPDNYIYVSDGSLFNYKIHKYNSSGSEVSTWALNYLPTHIAVSPDNYIYVTTMGYDIYKYDSSGNFITSWQTDAYPTGISASYDNLIYVTTMAGTSNVKVYSSTGSFLNSWTCAGAISIAVSEDDYAYIATSDRYVKKYESMKTNYIIQLAQTETTIGDKTSRTRYEYDEYGNMITQYNDGDISTAADDSTVWRTFYPNTSDNILNKVARERTYATIMETDFGGANLKAETLYYYDGNNTTLSTPPTAGNLTRQEQKEDSSNSTSSYFTYDNYGNILTRQDGNGNTTTWTYETTYHLYPLTKDYPVTGMSESYTFDPGTDNMLSKTDVNGQTTYYEYDTFKRQIKTIKPGDTSQSPSIQYNYNNWGTINQQNLETVTKVDANKVLWQKQFFDGLGRVVQVHAGGETGYTIISSTTTYNSIGSVDKQYVSQNINSTSLNYTTPDAGWKYVSYTYDGLGRVVTQTNADGTTIRHDYSDAWQETVTNEKEIPTSYFYDAYGQLVDVQENIIEYAYSTELGNQALADGEFNNPQGIAAYSEYSIFVVDSGNNRIQKFNSSGEYSLKWGSYGTGNGQFDNPGGIAYYSSYVYVADTGNNRIQKFNSSGNYSTKWGSYGTGDGQFDSPWGVAANSSYVYVVDTGNNRIQRFNTSGTFSLKWGSYGTGNGHFDQPTGIALDSSGNVYVVDSGNNRIQKFNSSGTFVTAWGTTGTGNGEFDNPTGIAVTYSTVYVADTGNNRIQKFDTSGTYTTQWGTSGSGDGQFAGPAGIAYNSGNCYVVDTGNDRVQKSDSSGTFIMKFGQPDSGNGNFINPVDITIGNSGSAIYIVDAGNNRIQYFTLNGTYTGKWGSYGTGDGQFNTPGGITAYSSYIYVTDSGNNRVQRFTTSGSYSAKWGSAGTGNGQFNNPQGIAADSAGNIYVVDTGNNRIQKFNSSGTYVTKWGNAGSGNSQFSSPTHIAIDSNDNIYVTDSGNNRIQVFSTSGTYIMQLGTSGTGEGQFDNPTGIAIDGGYIFVADSGNDRVQMLTSSGICLYQWGSGGSGNGEFDTVKGLAASGTTVYVVDSGNNRIQFFECQSVFTSTQYTYDVLGNLVQVIDDDGNITSITYNWLSQKTEMTDPDMGTWSYEYDDNGNLVSQTDAKGQVITFVYDDLNRLTNKNYEVGSGMTDIVYSYDDTSGGNYGVGKRTGMTDAAGTQSYIYDNRGRLLEETRTISATDYTTSYTYDGADRVATITYPTGETITNGYNERGLPYSVSGSVTGDLVTGAYYNQLGQITEINLGNSLKTTFGYYGLGGTYDTTGGYYGKLWEIATLPQAGGDAIQQVGYTWDACGNMATRGNALTLDMETFTYDSLDRLTGVSGAYTQTYTYDTIGNITSMNGVSYTYGDQPHAVTSVGNASYIYDDNGNMTDRDGQTITWDVENRPTTIDSETYVYDGDGNRIMKTVSGVTTLYINKYYDVNLSTTEETFSYYLGDRLVAQLEGETLKYIHQDSLSSSSVMSDSIGQAISTVTYFPFGATRTGSINTEKQFTGQRHDDTGLYYYGGRYYDSTIGRFISPDLVVQDQKIPQSLNRYTYCLNNPLKYVDPTGRIVWLAAAIAILIAVINAASVGYDLYALVNNPCWLNLGFLLLDVLDPSGVPWGACKGVLKAAGKNLWVMKALERGKAIENFIAGTEWGKKLGTHLVDNFPVIDFWNASTGTATSLKSIDLTAKTYSNLDNLSLLIKNYAIDLAGFAGHGDIQNSDILIRKLLLAIPDGATAEQLALIEELAKWAQEDLGVIIEWVKIAD